MSARSSFLNRQHTIAWIIRTIVGVLLLCLLSPALAQAGTRSAGQLAVAQPARETRTVGVIQVTADEFTALPGSKTRARGNIWLGSDLQLDNPPSGTAEVIYSSSAFTGTGSLFFKNEAVSLFSGPFSAAPSTGNITPGASAQFTLSTINGWAASSVRLTTINIPNARAQGTANLQLTVQGSDLASTASGNFVLTPGMTYTGSGIDATITTAGATLTVDNASLANGAISAASITLRLPSALGGQSKTISDFSLSPTALRLGPVNQSFAFPDIRWGTAVQLINNQASLHYDGQSTFELVVTSTVSLNLPQNVRTLAANAKLRTVNGQSEFTGSVRDPNNTPPNNNVVLSVAGATLTLLSPQLDNTGIRTSASLLLPAELGGASANFSNVTITTSGLNLGHATGQIPLPDITPGAVAGQSPYFQLINNLARLDNLGTSVGYGFTITGQAKFAVPGNAEQTVAVTFTLKPNAATFQLQGTISSLTLQVAGAQLQIGSLVLNNSGATATQVTIRLPEALGNLTKTVSGFSIGMDHLRLGPVNQNFDFPDVRWTLNGVTPLQLTGNKAALRYDGQSSFEFVVTSTVNLNLPQNTRTLAANAKLRMVNGQSQFSGSVRDPSNEPTNTDVMLQVAGATLKLLNPQLDNNGIRTGASLLMPAALGGASANFSDVTITKNGLDLGYAAAQIPLPDVTPGAVEGQTPRFQLTSNLATLDVLPNNGGYRFTVNSQAKFVLPDNPTQTVAVTFTLRPNAATFQLQGTIPTLTLQVAGTQLQITNLVLSGTGASVAQASLQLPAGLGGGTATIQNLVIDQTGLRFNGAEAGFTFPTVDFGAGADAPVKLRNNTAVLEVGSNGSSYRLLVTSTLEVNLPDAQDTATLRFKVEHDPEAGYQLSLVSDPVDLSFWLGAYLMLDDLQLRNDGLYVAQGVVKFPDDLGGGQLTINNVRITRDGFSFDDMNAVRTLPDITWGDGSILALRTITGTFELDADAFRIAASGTLHINVGDAPITRTISFEWNTVDGFSGSIDPITFTIAGTSVTLDEVGLDEDGLVFTLVVSLPAEIGGTVSHFETRIDHEGIKTGEASFLLPTITFGGDDPDTAPISILDGQLYIDNNEIRGSGNLVIVLPDENIKEVGWNDWKFEITSGNLQATIPSIELDVAGAKLTLAPVQIDNSGAKIATAKLKLPAQFGAGEVNLQNVSISKDGLRIGDGQARFPLPQFKWGDGTVVRFDDVTGLLEIFSDDIPRFRFAASGKLHLNLGATTEVRAITFAVTSDGVSGSTEAINAQIDGVAFALTGVEFNNDGLLAAAATVSLPAEIGGQVTVSDVRITSAGLSFDSASAQLPPITFGADDPATAPVSVISGTLVLNNTNGYRLRGTGTLRLRLPPALQDQPISFDLANGALNTTIPALDLQVAGTTLSLQTIAVNNAGLSVAQGTLKLPDILGSNTAVVNDITLNKNGLRIGSGTAPFALPAVKYGDGNVITIDSITGTLGVVDGLYQFTLNGSFNLKLGEVVQTRTISFAIRNGQISGSTDQISFTVDGTSLTLKQVAFNNQGVHASLATLDLPAAIGGTVSVSTAQITASGLTFGSAQATLPPITFGANAETAPISILNGTLLVVNDNGVRWRGNGTLRIRIPGNDQEHAVTFTLSNGQLNTTLPELTLDVAGAALALQTITITNDGAHANNGSLALPAVLGAQTAVVNDITLNKDGLRVGNGTTAFALPPVSLGTAIRVDSVSGTLSIANGAYQFAMNGTLQLDLADAVQTRPLTFALRNGELSGSTGQITVNIAGATLSLLNPQFGNGGFSTAATLSMPQSLGAGSAQFAAVHLTKDGLDLGHAQGQTPLPTLRIAGSAEAPILQLIDNQAGFESLPNHGGYKLTVAGKLRVDLPDNAAHTFAASFTLSPDGANSVLTGEVDQLTLELAGTKLQMADLVLTRSGATVASATMKLPDALGGGTTTISDVGINDNGLAFANIGAGFDLPDVRFGEGTTPPVALRGNQATLQVGANGSSYQLLVQSTLQLNLPINSQTAGLQFKLERDSQTEYKLSLNSQPLDFQLRIAGATLLLDDVVLNNTGLGVAQANLRLPSELGSGESTVQNVQIGAGGLSFDQMQANFGAIPLAGETVKLLNNQATLSTLPDNAGYRFTVASQLQIALPENSPVVPLQYTLDADGSSFRLQGELATLNLSLAAAQLGMQNITVGNNGLHVAQASVTLPPVIGGTSTVQNVRINRDGLSMDNAQIEFSPINFGGDGSQIAILQPKVTLQIADNRYRLDGSGTLRINLPDNQQQKAIGFTLSNGQLNGQIDGLDISMGGGTLALRTLALNNAGLRVDSAQLTLPAALGSGVVTLQKIAITKDGLSIDEGRGTWDLPPINIGDGTALQIAEAKASLVIRDGHYRFAVNGKIALNVDGAIQKLTLDVTLDDQGRFTGSTPLIEVVLDGLKLAMHDVVVDNDGLRTNRATLQLPAPLSATGVIDNVRITGAGVTFDQAVMSLTPITFGAEDPTTAPVKLVDGTLRLRHTNGYHYEGNGKLVITLPDNQRELQIGFGVGDGQFSATVPGFDLALPGGTLALGGLTVSNDGIAVPTATYNLQPELGSGQATFQNIRINKDGLRIGTGDAQFSLPVIKIGDGSVLRVIEPKARLQIENNSYRFTADGQLALLIEAVERRTAVTFTLNSAGQIAGSVDQLAVPIDGVTLSMNNAQFSNNGLQIAQATLVLPDAIGNAQITNLAITGAGVAFNNAQVAVPAITFGDPANSKIKIADIALRIDNVAGSYRLRGEATFQVRLPDNEHNKPINFTLGNGEFNATLGELDLNVAGSTLQLRTLTIGNSGVGIGNAKLVLSQALGGAEATLQDVVLNAQGLQVGNGTVRFPLPDIQIGDGSDPVLKLTQVRGLITISDNHYAIGFGATLHLNLPENNRTIPVDNFTVSSDGRVRGKVNEIPLNIGGAATTLRDVQFSTEGLSVGQATITLPPSLGSVQGTARNIRITRDGLSLDEAGITIPDINVGAGSQVKIARPKVLVNAQGTTYTLTLAATLEIRIPENTRDFPFTVLMNSEGAWSATLNQITLKVASADLDLVNAQVSSNGVQVASGALRLPQAMGGVHVALTNIRIDGNGLTVGGGGASFPVPQFNLGGDSGFRVTPTRGVIELANDRTFRLGVDATIHIDVPGTQADATGRILLDSRGRVTGRVNGFGITIAGLNLQITNAEIDGKVIKAQSAGLKLPDAWGGGGVTVYNIVADRQNGVKIGGGTFDLPSIKAGSFTLASLRAGMRREGSGYVIEAGGRFGVPGLGGDNAVGACGLNVSITIFADFNNQAALSISPANPDTPYAEVDGIDRVPNNALSAMSVRLRNVTIGLHGCDIPVANTGLFLTKAQGSVTLEGGSTRVRLEVELVAAKKVAGLSVVSIDGWEELNTNPFEMSIGGALKVFIFEVAGAEAHVTANSFSASLFIDQLIYRGDVTISAWNDRFGFHFTGSGNFEIGIPKGKIFDKKVLFAHIRIPPFNLTLGNIGVDVGEFTNRKWGIKGRVCFMGYCKGVYIDTGGNLDFGNVNEYRLVTPRQVMSAAKAFNEGVAATDADLAGIHVAPTGEVSVTTPITTTSNLLFVLYREGNEPQFQLRAPDGTLITPQTLPAGMEYVEAPVEDENGRPMVQVMYGITGAQPGDWQQILVGPSVSTMAEDQYIMLVLGQNAEPKVDAVNVVATPEGNALRWQLASPSANTQVRIFANSGAIATTAVITDTNGTPKAVEYPLFVGQPVAIDLPTAVDGTPQQQLLDVSRLPSGTYRVWLEADDNENAPVRVYAPEPLVVDQRAVWQPTWSTPITITTNQYRQIELGWLPYGNPDADDTRVLIGTDPLKLTDVYTVGQVLSTVIGSFDPGTQYHLALETIDRETGNVARSAVVSATPLGAQFDLAVDRTTIELAAGSSATVAVKVTTSMTQFPDAVGLQATCAPTTVATAAPQVQAPAADAPYRVYLPLVMGGNGGGNQQPGVCQPVDGLTMTFEQSLVVPTQDGVLTTATIVTTAGLQPGHYTIPIKGWGGGSEQTIQVEVVVKGATTGQ